MRIIGGKLRGKNLQFPGISGLRPTPNRVRETVFNWLMHDIAEAHCLDAFAGSGALGIEAYSRGAASVTLLELNTCAYVELSSLTQKLNSTKLNVVKTDALKFLQKSSQQFSIIFLDPPFATDYISQCIEIINQTQILAPNGLIYIEANQKFSLTNPKWLQLKLKKTASLVYGLYQKVS